MTMWKRVHFRMWLVGALVDKVMNGLMASGILVRQTLSDCDSHPQPNDP
jgi:hypothetical protein